MFTYHGKDARPLDELAPDCVKKIDIADEEIDDLVDHLRDAGVTHYRMLQDPDSLGLDITEDALRSGILWQSVRMPLSVGAVEEEIASSEPTPSAEIS